MDVTGCRSCRSSRVPAPHAGRAGPGRAAAGDAFARAAQAYDALLARLRAELAAGDPHAGMTLAELRGLNDQLTRLAAHLHAPPAG
jgi:hypothetical protein